MMEEIDFVVVGRRSGARRQRGWDFGAQYVFRLRLVGQVRDAGSRRAAAKTRLALGNAVFRGAVGLGQLRHRLVRRIERQRRHSGSRLGKNVVSGDRILLHGRRAFLSPGAEFLATVEAADFLARRQIFANGEHDLAGWARLQRRFENAYGRRRRLGCEDPLAALTAHFRADGNLAFGQANRRPAKWTRQARRLGDERQRMLAYRAGDGGLHGDLLDAVRTNIQGEIQPSSQGPSSR